MGKKTHEKRVRTFLKLTMKVFVCCLLVLVGMDIAVRLTF